MTEVVSQRVRANGAILCAPIVGSIVCLFGLPVQAASITGLDLQFIGDSNPARAEFESDIEGTTAAKVRATGTLYSVPLREEELFTSGVAIGASASASHDADIEELGETRVGLSLGAFFENRRVRGTPFIRTSIGVSYLDSESAIRDSVLVDLGLSLNVQPTAFFDATLGLLVESREAETDVFDTLKSQIFLTGNFSPFERIVLRAGARLVVGQEVSTATPTLAIVGAAQVIEPDDAFGGVEAGRFAYLIDATSAILETGVGLKLGQRVETNLLYRYINTSADADIGYDRNMIEFTISLDFD